MDAHQIAASVVALIAIVSDIVVIVCLWRMTRELRQLRQQHDITIREAFVQDESVWREVSVVDVERRC